MSESALWRKEALLLVEDCTEELVSRAETLHKEVSLAVLDHLDSLCNRLEFVRIVDHCEDVHIESFLLASLCDECLVTDKSNICESKLYSLSCSCYSVTVDTPRSDHSLSIASASELGIDLFEICKHCIRIILPRSEQCS